LSSRRLSHAGDVLLHHPLVCCGYCEGSLTTIYEKKRGYHFYRCANRVRTGTGERQGACSYPGVNLIKSSTLDDACWAWFIEQLTHPERLQVQYEVYLANVAKAQEEGSSQRTAVEAARTQAKEQEDSYLAAVGSAKSDDMRERFVQLAEEAHEQYVTLTGTLEELTATEAERKEQAAVIKSFQEAAPQAVRNLEGASMKEKRMILYRFGVRAYLWEKTHEPRYEFHWVFDSDVFCSDPRVGARRGRRGDHRHLGLCPG
jgi:hypothetical protein